MIFSDLPPSGTVLTDEQAMKLCLDLAQRGAGWVSPNPCVGCVILDSNHKLLSTGYHKKWGDAHAEAHALQNLLGNPLDFSQRDQLKDARIFVSLEPCAHEGKTPSCAKLLTQFPIREVIYGIQDPNPLVAGKGAEILSTAGIQVRPYEGPLADEIEAAAEHFLFNFREKRIWTSLKVATSLDGFIALKNGESRWITGESARNYTHYLRGLHDGILVGVNTFLIDDPSLNVRHPLFPGKSNKVIILDPKGQSFPVLKESQVYKNHKPENVFIVTSDETSAPGGLQVQHLQVPMLNSTSLNLAALNLKLWDLGLKSLLVEGGATTLSEFIKQGLAQRLYQFMAPTLLGGQGSLSWTRALQVDHMSEKIELKSLKVLDFSPDLLITGLFRAPQQAL